MDASPTTTSSSSRDELACQRVDRSGRLVVVRQHHRDPAGGGYHLSFILKAVLAADLLSAIRVVTRGDAVVAPSVTRRLVERHVRAAVPVVAAGEPLTAREREVLAQVARGLSNVEIAGRLYVSEGTVKTHVSRILAKLGLRDRVQAVVYAYERGLTRTDPPPVRGSPGP